MKLADRFHPAPLSLTAVAVAFGLWLSDYWTFVITGGLTTGLVALSVGIVYGRTGMVSLCQLSFAAIGAWVMAWLNVHSSLPFVVMLLTGALVATPVGLIIGLLSLRLRGVSLAVATLGFASASMVLIREHPFPGTSTNTAIARPAGFQSENRYFLFCCLIFALVVGLVGLVSRTRTGRAWLAVRHSERATAALGLPVARVKLLAFGLGAFVAAIAGGLMSGHTGLVSIRSFEPFDSLLILAVAVVAGARYVDGALAAGLLGSVLPELFRLWHIPLDVAPMLFGLGVVVVLSQGADGAHGQLRASLAELRNRRHPLAPSVRGGDDENRDSPPDGATLSDSHIRPEQSDRTSASPGITLDVRDLTVAYGAVVALDSVDLEVRALSVHGLIGPNGAGKSTCIDAITGFITPRNGSVLLNGVPLDGRSVHHRVRAGLRRTFQQGRTVPDLTVGEYLHLASGQTPDLAEQAKLLRFFGCPPAEQLIGSVDVATRRLIEVTACLAARPSIVLLDEPGAGLGEDESLRLAACIAAIPQRFECSVLLIEHDMAIVRRACDHLTVLDQGQVIASGEPAHVLADPTVIRAYLGELPETSETPPAVIKESGLPV